MQQIDKWHKTRVGLLVFALVELGLAYGGASWAIDSGNLLLYVVTIVLFFGSLQNFAKLIRNVIHGKRQTS
jgi:hypothetical protein